MDNLSFLERPKLNGEISIVGIPLDLGKDSVGTDKGPAALRKEGVSSMLEEIGYKVEDVGDISCPDQTMAEVGNTKAKYLDAIVTVSENIAKVVAEKIKSGKKILAIGGDNTISIGTLSGAGEAFKDDLGVIWIDAHADINTDETSLSGNVHGMPISAALGLGNKSLVGIRSAGRKLKPENLVYVGLKDLDQAEVDIIREQKIASVTMLEIAEQGLAPAFEKIKKLSQKVSKVWVCLDIDSMDEECAPGTPMATRGGLNYRESLNLAKYIGKVCNVAGVDVSELAPDLDSENKTSRLVVELIANYFGGQYSWYTRYMNEEQKKQAKRRG
ncbi:MAG: arginase [Patescibacteria group bacterium]|jgi:arginase